MPDAITIIEGIGLEVKKLPVRSRRFSNGDKYRVMFEGKTLMHGLTFGQLRHIAQIIQLAKGDPWDGN